MLLQFNKAKEMEAYLITVMHLLFLFKLAWLNLLLFAVCQVNLTAQWNASHSWQQCVGSFWSTTKEIERHLPLVAHSETYTDTCESTCISLFTEHTPTHLDMHVQTQVVQIYRVFSHNASQLQVRINCYYWLFHMVTYGAYVCVCVCVCVCVWL